MNTRQRALPEDEYYWKEGCHILELSNSSSDPDLSIARARVAPGVTTQWHCLQGVAERYVILEGNGIVEVGGEESLPVTVADVVLIPPGVRQRITNSGSTQLVFLALCTPRFELACYRALE